MENIKAITTHCENGDAEIRFTFPETLTDEEICNLALFISNINQIYERYEVEDVKIIQADRIR